MEDGITGKYRFPIASPCCKGAALGINHTYYGYKIYGCMGCGKPIERKLALTAIALGRHSAFQFKASAIRILNEITIAPRGEKEPNMNPEPKRTPLPWIARDSFGDADSLYGPNDKFIGRVNNRDAAFIVRATNHYELMLELLRDIYNSEEPHENHKVRIKKAFDSMGEVF